jgi:hypothetical protein
VVTEYILSQLSGQMLLQFLRTFHLLSTYLLLVGVVAEQIEVVVVVQVDI